MTEQKIPPRNEWVNMSVTQLLELKSNMQDLYYNMRSINASFAPQYGRFISEIDALIQRRDRERALAEHQEQ